MGLRRGNKKRSPAKLDTVSLSVEGFAIPYSNGEMKFLNYVR